MGINGHVETMGSGVPIGFIHRDGALWLTPRARSAWLDDLRADSAVCATIDESTGSMRKLVARGDLGGNPSADGDVGRHAHDDGAQRARRSGLVTLPTGLRGRASTTSIRSGSL